MDLGTVTRLVIAIVGHFRLSGRNRGIDWRNQYRAEPLRLALPWVQDEAGCFAHVSLLHVIARPRQGPRQSVPFSGDRKGRNYGENVRFATPRGYPRGGPQAPFGRFN